MNNNKPNYKSLNGRVLTVAMVAASIFALQNAYAGSVTRTCDAKVTVDVGYLTPGTDFPTRFIRKSMDFIEGTGRSSAKRSRKSKARAKARDNIRACFDEQLHALKTIPTHVFPSYKSTTTYCTGVTGWSQHIIGMTLVPDGKYFTEEFNGYNYSGDFIYTVIVDIDGPDRCEGKDHAETFLRSAG